MNAKIRLNNRSCERNLWMLSPLRILKNPLLKGPIVNYHLGTDQDQPSCFLFCAVFLCAL